MSNPILDEDFEDEVDMEEEEDNTLSADEIDELKELIRETDRNLSRMKEILGMESW